MKQIYFTLFSFVLLISLNAQDIPNASFEDWEDLGGLFPYQDPVGWNSPNELTALAGLTVVMPSENASDGDLSAYLETKQIFTFAAPGALTLGELVIDSENGTGEISGGVPFTKRPNALKGQFIIEPVGTDFPLIGMSLTRWNTEENKRDTVGIAGYIYSGPLTEWTELNMPVLYLLPEVDPDTMNIFIVSSNLLAGVAGSKLYVDALSLELPNNVSWNPAGEKVNVYPNPSAEFVTIESFQNLTHAELSVFDQQGRLVEKRSYSGDKANLDCSQWAPGVYSFKLLNRNKLVYNGKFVVK